MSFSILIPVLAVMGLLYLKKVGTLTWIFAYWAGIYVLLKWGFTIPIPQSVLGLYMGIVTLSLVIYAASEEKRLRCQNPSNSFAPSPTSLFTPTM